MRNPTPQRSDYLTTGHGIANLLFVIGAHVSLIAAGVLLSSYGQLGPTLSALVWVPLALAHQKYLSEWIHEASHFNLFPTRSFNDFFTNFAIGALFANDITVHRAGHLQHHRRTSFFDDQDPDTKLLAIRSKSELYRALICDLTGVTAVRMFLSSGDKSSTKKRSPLFFAWVLTLQVLLISISFATGYLWMYVAYYLTLITLYPLLNRLRVYGQHAEFKEDGTVLLSSTGISRTTDSGLADRFFMTSKLMLFHYEHHLYPHLPYRALEKICEKSESQNQFTVSRLQLLKKIHGGLK